MCISPVKLIVPVSHTICCLPVSHALVYGLRAGRTCVYRLLLQKEYGKGHGLGYITQVVIKTYNECLNFKTFVAVKDTLALISL